MFLLGLFYLAAFGFGADLMSRRLFPDWTRGKQIWIAGSIAMLGVMWMVVPFAFFTGFNLTAHFLGLGLFALITLGILRFVPRKPDVQTESGSKTEAAVKLDTPAKKELQSRWTVRRIQWMLAIPVIILFAYLFHTHLIPVQDGAVHTGQSTFGDLNLHLGIATSIAEQQQFPPQYSIYPGTKLSYPFLIDSLSSTFLQFGFNLRWSFLIPSMWAVVLLVSGFLIWADELLRNRLALVIASLFFFLNGGFGFIYFLDNFHENDGFNFFRIFTEFYQTPTNLVGNNIRWTNVIADMIVPQRTLMAGWAFIFLIMYLLYMGVNNRDRRLMVVAAVITGLMPMVHTHTFLAVGLLCTAWLVVFWFEAKDKGRYFSDWMIFAGIALVLAVPQLLYWTLQQSTAGGFLRWNLDWVNEKDHFLWFWTKNLGVIFLYLIPAFLAIPKRLKQWYAGPLLIFAVAEVIQFQPNEYDNNKLLLVWFMWSVIIVSIYLVGVYQQLSALRFRAVTLAIIVFLGTFSGALTIGREIVSDYELYGKSHLKAAEWALESTPKDALFLTSDNHNNAIASISGRNIYLGTGSFLYFHGFDTSTRSGEVRSMYTQPDVFPALSQKAGIDYVLFSDFERGQFQVDDVAFAQSYPVAFEHEGVRIFAVSDRARQLLAP